MSASSRRCLLVLAALGIASAACHDDNPLAPGLGVPAPVSWMSWIGGANVGEQVQVRLLGTRSGCDPFRVSVVPEGTRIRILAEEERVANDPCLARDILVIYDTTVTLPRIGEGVYAMEALTWGPTGIATRAFGSLTIASGGVFDALLKSAGHGLVVADSAGCSWVRPQLQIPAGDPFVFTTDVALSPGWHGAFISGSHIQGPARCGQTQQFTVDFLDVTPPPGPAPGLPTARRLPAWVEGP